MLLETQILTLTTKEQSSHKLKVEIGSHNVSLNRDHGQLPAFLYTFPFQKARISVDLRPLEII